MDPKLSIMALTEQCSGPFMSGITINATAITRNLSWSYDTAKKQVGSCYFDHPSWIYVVRTITPSHVS